MIEVRLHGRGGQGAVTAAEVLAVAGFMDGKWTQAFPRFGPERRNAPVEAYCRFDNEFIQLRYPVYEPDYVIVLDPSLLGSGALGGIKKTSTLIVNSNKIIKTDVNVYRVDATSIALQTLGKEIVNTAMLGAVAKTGLVSLDSILNAIAQKFPKKLVEKNQQVVKEAYDACINE